MVTRIGKWRRAAPDGADGGGEYGLDGPASAVGDRCSGRGSRGSAAGNRGHAAGEVRVPAPRPGERFAWRFAPGDRFAFQFDPDAGDGTRYPDRVVFRYGGGEVTLLGPSDAQSLRQVIVRLPDRSELPLDVLVPDDSAVDAIARSLIQTSD